MSVAALLAAFAIQAEPAAFSVTATELLGLTPAEVALRLGAHPDPLSIDALTMAEGGTRYEVFPAQRFWRIAPAGQRCVTGFPQVASPEPVEESATFRLTRRSAGQYVFRDGRLVAIHPQPLRIGSDGTRDGLREWAARLYETSPWPLAWGRLPLSDGEAGLDRLATPAGLTIDSRCDPVSAAAPVRSGDLGTDIIWAAIAIPIYLLNRPFASAEEARAEREGGALLALAEPGEALPAGVDAVVRGRRGVRLFRDPEDPGFAVVAVKLGRGDDHNADLGLFGVRDDRVVWRVQRRAAEALRVGAVVCMDASGRSAGHRPGCSSTGHLQP